MILELQVVSMIGSCNDRQVFFVDPDEVVQLFTSESIISEVSFPYRSDSPLTPPSPALHLPELLSATERDDSLETECLLRVSTSEDNVDSELVHPLPPSTLHTALSGVRI